MLGLAIVALALAGDVEPGVQQEPANEPAEEPAEAPEPDDGIVDLGELDALPGMPPSVPAPSGPDPGADPDGGPDPTAPSGPPSEASAVASTPTVQAAGESSQERFGDIFTGSVRLTGAFLHFDDIPELFPTGDDALFASVFRVIAKRDLGAHVGFELNYFLDVARLPGGGNATGAFVTAGAAESVYRTPYLRYRFWNDGDVGGTLGLDRYRFDIRGGPVTVTAGRFPVTYSVSGLLTPNDFFAPFAAAAVNRIYKPGIDGLQVGSPVGKTSSVEVLGALGNDDGGTPTWGRSGLVARASTVRWGFEWAVLGGKVAERWVAGGSVQGGVGPVGLHGEGHVGVPDTEGDGRDAEDETRPVHGRLAAGPTLQVGWRGLTLGAEYAYVSDGARRPSDYLTRAQSRFPDDQPLLARHYLGANGSIQIVPILTGSVFALVNGNDGSGLTGLSLLYNVADEADLIAGLFVPWGRDPVATGDPMLPVRLRSELGASPLTLYLEARAFF